MAAYEGNISTEVNPEIIDDSFKVDHLRIVAQVLNLKIQNKRQEHCVVHHITDALKMPQVQGNICNECR